MRQEKTLLTPERGNEGESVPIPSPEKTREKRIVKLVDTMLALNKQLAAAKTPHEQASLRAQIDATDAQIDAIVYQLYGLTSEEIALVEAATSNGKE